MEWSDCGGAVARRESATLQVVIQELIDSEQRFGEDLMMVRNVFMKPMALVLDEQAIGKLFLNWNDLIKLSKKLHSGLSKHDPGRVFCSRIDALEAFVYFCEQQQSAIDYMHHLEKTDAKFRKCHMNCQRHELAKGVSLSYYLLIPMSRITRYPLLFEKMLKHANLADPQYEVCEDVIGLRVKVLHNTHQLLQSLCARVNNAISEIENKNILCWSQRNIRCPKLDLEFTSETREVGPRRYLHSGVLYKLKGGRTLVALLFNDFFLLTTPVEAIPEVTKHEDAQLVLYKTPLMLKQLELTELSAEGHGFQLKNNDLTVQLRAESKNGTLFWVKQIQKAIDDYDVANQLRSAANRSQQDLGEKDVGSLSMEVHSLSRSDLPSSQLELLLDLEQFNQPKLFKLDLQTTREPLFNTQFPLKSIKQQLKASFLVPKRFRPDFKVGQFTEDVLQLVRISAHHHGPIVRKLELKNSELPGKSCEVVVKFVLHLND